MRSNLLTSLAQGLIAIALLAAPLTSVSAQEPAPPPLTDNPAVTYRTYLPLLYMNPCTNLVRNGGFENNTDWLFVPSARPAVYSTAIAHSGARSLLAGITSPASIADARSEVYQDVFIPPNSASARLRLWLYPISTVTPIPAPSLEAPALGADFSEAPLVEDTQYVVILNTSGVLQETLVWWQPTNLSTWTYVEFELAKYAGQTIRLLLGVYNNNYGGVTAMFADDVSLTFCPGQPVSNCANLFDNSGFEFTRTWGIPATAYPAAYSTEVARTGSRSMRTGISTGLDTYSYSDAYQYVSIPSNATQAKLRLWYYPISGEAGAAPIPGEAPARLDPPQPGEAWGNAPLSPDVQYILILDQNSTIVQTLLWTLSNSQTWTYFEADLLAYKGKTIRVQFGTFNDGGWGKTAMFVDDASVDVCSGTPPPPPPPPPNCSEYLLNTSFENASGWQIPVTQYTAGYSTLRWRTGARSMRTGIVYAWDNTYSYSDFRQVVSLPSNISSATLTAYIYPMSGEPPMAPSTGAPVATGAAWGEVPQASDAQYLLVLDAYGNWINTLYWDRTNTQTWTKLTLNLSGYKGSTIQLQFGSYNDGGSGVTAMYVDDASLWVCP